MHDSLPNSSQAARAGEAQQQTDNFLQSFLELSPDEQVKRVNMLHFAMGEEAMEDQRAFNYVADCLDAIRQTDAPVAFLARDLTKGNPQLYKTSDEVLDQVRRTKLIAGIVPVECNDYSRKIIVHEEVCRDVFHTTLPNVPEKSIQRFGNFWSGSDAPAMVKNRFGVDIVSLNLADQVNMINFVIDTPWNSPRLQTMESFFATNGPEKGVAALRALEFGEDYGDSILAIAKNATPEQSKEVFDIIAGFRKSSAAIAKWYESYDLQMAKNVELAMNERLVDALYAMEALARDGKLEIDTAPHRENADYENDGRFMMRLESVDSGIEIMKSLEKSLRLQHEIVTALDVKVSRVVDEGNEQFTVYRFASKEDGDALLYVRPQGAKGSNRDFEYGNRKGVEASISFIVNPTDPHHVRSDKDPQGVSIRFDREGRSRDESPASETRDPTREDGSISLDISSSLGDGRNMPVRIGRFIAAGNILRAQKTGGEINLHHNMNHFDQARYGTSEGFAKLAIYVAHMAEAMMYVQQHGSHNSRYSGLPGILRQAGVEPAA